MINDQLVLWVVLAVIAIFIVGGGGYYLFKMNNNSTPVVTTAPEVTSSNNQNTQTNTSNASITPSDPDIAAVTAIAQKLKQAYLNNDQQGVSGYSSVATQNIFASGSLTGKIFSSETLTGSKDITIGQVVKNGSQVVVNLTITKTNGAPINMAWIFIKENGAWKFDVPATMQYAMQGGAVPSKTVSSNTAGYIDFVVTGAQVYPAHPIVNSKDVEIVFNVKNIGTETATKGFTTSTTILENKRDLVLNPSTSADIEPVPPGGTVNWSFEPYEANDFFHLSDTAGLKTIQLVVNSDKSVKESNYNNDTYTIKVQMYAQ